MSKKYYKDIGKITPLDGGYLKDIGKGFKKVFGGYHHDAGGGPVTPDGEAEFEKHEIIGKANLKDGGLTDYVFSEYLNTDGSSGYSRTGGKTSIASVAENLANMNAPQQEFDKLAALQEEVAGRDGDIVQVAKTGGPTRYQTQGPITQEEVQDTDLIEGDLTYNYANLGERESGVPTVMSEEFNALFKTHRDNMLFYRDHVDETAWSHYHGSDDYWTYKELSLELQLFNDKADYNAGNKSMLHARGVETWDEYETKMRGLIEEERMVFLESQGDQATLMNKELSHIGGSRYHASNMPLSIEDVTTLKGSRLSEAAYLWENEWDDFQKLAFIMDSDLEQLPKFMQHYYYEQRDRMDEAAQPLFEQFNATKGELLDALNNIGEYGATKSQEELMGSGLTWLMEDTGFAEFASGVASLFLSEEGSNELGRDWTMDHIENLSFEDWVQLGMPEHYGDIYQYVLADALKDRLFTFDFGVEDGSQVSNAQLSDLEMQQLEEIGLIGENSDMTQLSGMNPKVLRNVLKYINPKKWKHISSIFKGKKNVGKFQRNVDGKIVFGKPYSRSGPIGFKGGKSGKKGKGSTGGKGGASETVKKTWKEKTWKEGLWGSNKNPGVIRDMYGLTTTGWFTKTGALKRYLSWQMTHELGWNAYSMLYPNQVIKTPGDIKNHPNYDPNAKNFGPEVKNPDGVYDIGIPDPDNYTKEQVDSAILSAPNAQQIYEGIGYEFKKEGGFMNFVDVHKQYRQGGPIKYQTRGFQFAPYQSLAQKSDLHNPFYPGYKMGKRKNDIELELDKDSNREVNYKTRGAMNKRFKYKRGNPINLKYRTRGRMYQDEGTIKPVESYQETWNKARSMGQMASTDNPFGNIIPSVGDYRTMKVDEITGTPSNKPIDFMSMINKPPAGPVAPGGTESMFSGVKSEQEQKMYDEFIASEGPDPNAQTYNIGEMGVRGWRGLPPTPTKSQVIQNPLTSGFTPVPKRAGGLVDNLEQGITRNSMALPDNPNVSVNPNMPSALGLDQTKTYLGGGTFPRRPRMYQGTDTSTLSTTQVASTVPITAGGQELTVSDFESIPGQQPFIQGQYNVTGVDDPLVLYGDAHMSGLYGGAGGNLDSFFDDWKSNLNPDVLTAAGLDGENWKEQLFSGPIKDKKGNVIGYEGVGAYQDAWNELHADNPELQIRKDNKLGEQTFRTAAQSDDPIEIEEDPKGDPCECDETLLSTDPNCCKEEEETPGPMCECEGLEHLAADDEGCVCNEEEVAMCACEGMENIPADSPECKCDETPTETGHHAPKDLRWLIPTIGGLAQLIAPFKAQKLEPEEINAPILGKENMERVDFNAQLASGNAETRGMSKFLETSGGGPANIAAKMAAFAANRDSQMKIKSEEAAQNAQIANAEASLNANIGIENAKNSLVAQKYNADSSMDVKKTKLAAWDAFGNRVAGMAGDTMAYLAERDKARAYAGDPGILHRNRFFGHRKNQHLLNRDGTPTEEGHQEYIKWATGQGLNV